jgi:hypothetical protein
MYVDDDADINLYVEVYSGCLMPELYPLNNQAQQGCCTPYVLYW